MVALLLLSLTALADDRIFSVGRCRNLGAAEEARLRAIDQRLTPRAAFAADEELRVRLAAKLAEPARREPSTRALMATLEGWLTKKEWLAARARHEHDADEAGDYCEFLRRQAGMSP